MTKIFFDCETDGLLLDMTQVHCIATIIDDGEVHSFGPDELDEGVIESVLSDRRFQADLGFVLDPIPMPPLRAALVRLGPGGDYERIISESDVLPGGD
jgi:hypothetical protein